MNAVTVENFRCFGERQTARLAPLTLLVGENSTGKTSFLALLRALDDLAHGATPDFKRPPYDLGSFDEIAHYAGGHGGRAETFRAEVVAWSAAAGSQGERKLSVEFGKDGTAPVPVRQKVSLVKAGGTDSQDDAWIDVNLQSSSIKIGTKRGTWNLRMNNSLQLDGISAITVILITITSAETPSKLIESCKPEEDSPDAKVDDIQDWSNLFKTIIEMRQLPPAFASAPVRSQPRRTYDPGRDLGDPEGDYIPMLLAKLSSQQPGVWANLKQGLEQFGQSSGLFDEIRIRHFSQSDSDPFQVQVRKSGRPDRKGPWRNLVDVGYGISQALPIITELLRDGAEQQSPKSSGPRQFLLQQPEVHLHPSAQAALGSLFCQVAGPGRQLIVETHSDNLMDRVRMDVRDGVSGLKPEDVSILFFERDRKRDGMHVRIHSLRIDQEGNVLDVPDGYRQFFMNEMTRSLWPERERSAVEA